MEEVGEWDRWADGEAGQAFLTIVTVKVKLPSCLTLSTTDGPISCDYVT